MAGKPISAKIDGRRSAIRVLTAGEDEVIAAAAKLYEEAMERGLPVWAAKMMATAHVEGYQTAKRRLWASAAGFTALRNLTA